MLSRRDFLAGATAALGATLSAGNARAANAGSGLNEVARRSGRIFGAAVRMDQVSAEPGLANAVASQCGMLTPEIHLKWNSIEYRKGQVWYQPVDALVKHARRQGQMIYGHTLIWEQGTPDWALHHLHHEKDWDFIAAHFERLLKRYRADIPVWDVVNEPIDTQNGSNGLRRNTFQRIFGSGYIEQALHTARHFAPEAKLMLNDYSFEYDNYVEADRRRAFLKLLEKLKAKGVPLDGVGIQAHLDLGKGLLRHQTIAPFLQAIADMGLEIYITELDVKERDYRATAAIRDQRVADEVARYLDIALDQRAVKGVTTWGLSDKHSWLKVERGDRVDRRRYGNPAPNRGLPYDVSMKPKLMYKALERSLGGSLS